jgi:hypothetical protein
VKRRSVVVVKFKPLQILFRAKQLDPGQASERRSKRPESSPRRRRHRSRARLPRMPSQLQSPMAEDEARPRWGSARCQGRMGSGEARARTPWWRRGPRLLLVGQPAIVVASGAGRTQRRLGSCLG